MSVRSHRLLLIATAAIFSVAGCKQTPAPSETAPVSQPTAASAPQIGGQDVVRLNRAATSDGKRPEFLSATVLPGRGMNLFQITANIPGKGEIPLLFSPSLADAAVKLNGGPDDQNGNASFTFGGAFLVPYPNRILGKLSADESTVTTQWHGKTITLPANWGNSKDKAKDKHAMHGLILASQTQDVKTVTTADGQTVTGTIHAGNFGGHWLSNTDLNFTITLTANSVEVTIAAKNMGNEDEPIAIGWHPYFAIPSGDRTQARLHIPGAVTAVVNNYDDVFPTGELLPVKGTKYDFTSADGKALGDMYLDDNWSKLTRTEGAVDVNLTDPEAHYGIRVLGVSPEIKTVQVYAPPTKEFTAIEEQFNFGDPFGKEWKGMDTGMVTLKPDQSVTWRTRLELFTPAAK
jgi:aldose 1-epimerase